MQMPQLNDRFKTYVALLVVLLIILATFTVAWYLWSPPKPKQETYQPEAKQKDGSVILEKKPDAGAKAEHQLPKGAKLERKIKITVQAKAPLVNVSGSVELSEKPVEVKSSGSSLSMVELSEASANVCPPVTVDLSLVKMPDDTRRVIASSSDGNILGGVDIPVEAAASVPEPKKWAAGLVVDPFKKVGGAFVDRDLGWLRLGVQVNQKEQGDLPNQAWLKAGIRF